MDMIQPSHGRGFELISVPRALGFADTRFGTSAYILIGHPRTMVLMRDNPAAGNPSAKVAAFPNYLR